MLVEPIADAGGHREQISERLIATHAGIAYDHGDPGAPHGWLADVDRAPDRADMGRRIEGGADLVMDDRRANRTQQLEHRRQVVVHPLGALRPGHARDADHSPIGELGQLLGRRHIDEQDRGQARESGDLHGGRRPREVVAVEGDQRSFRKRSDLRHWTTVRAARFGAIRARERPFALMLRLPTLGLETGVRGRDRRARCPPPRPPRPRAAPTLRRPHRPDGPRSRRPL